MTRCKRTLARRCHRGHTTHLFPRAALPRPMGLWRKDAAASPVIGVIMMVGTTVILSAAVFTWTSAYGNVPGQPVNVIALASEGPIADGVKNYTLAAAMPGLRYEELGLTLDGARLEQDKDGSCERPAAGTYTVCRGNAPIGEKEVVTASDRVLVPATYGQTLRVVHDDAGFVILTLDIT